MLRISIHALLAESDSADCNCRSVRPDFYPRSPCGERLINIAHIIHGLLFLSTLSLRRATCSSSVCTSSTVISIHALLAESDSENPMIGIDKIPFLSTLSLRRATQVKQTCRVETSISIHALLAESDNTNLRRHRRNNDFYPRSPCGERRENQRLSARPTKDFYPRSPCGERPVQIVVVIMHALISIHALLAESDVPQYHILDDISDFYPRSPCGERQQAKAFKVSPLCISIHALLAESDYLGAWKSCNVCHFYPRSPCGERQQTAYFL